MPQRDLEERIDRELHILATGDDRAAMGAAKRLARIGSPAIGPLVASLKTNESGSIPMQRVAQAIHAQGVEGVVALAKLLDHPDLVNRKVVICTLCLCELDLTPIVPKLPALLDTRDHELEGFVLWALEYADIAARNLFWQVLVARFDSQPEMQWQILSHADTLTSDVNSVIRLCLRVLDDPPGPTPLVAADESECLGSQGNSATDVASNAPGDRAAIVRSTALEALAKIGPRAAIAIPLVAAAARDPNLAVRLDAVRAVWAITGDPDQVRSSLLCVLERSGRDGANLVFDLLTRLGPCAATGVPWISSFFRAYGEDPRVRQNAAEALSAIAPEGGLQAIELLIGLIGDTDLRVTDAAAKGLAKHGAAAVEPLSRLVREGNDRTREWAMVALAQSGAQAADAAGTLTDAMQVQVDRIRWWAAIALAEINGDPATVPVLIECLEQGGAYMQYRAAKAVGAVGHAARPANRQLKRLRRHHAFTVRDAAAEALERIAAAG